MEFMWLCRDTDDYDFVVSNVSSEPLIYPNAPIQNTNTSGCFGTGRGRLNSTDLILEMDTRMMTEDETLVLPFLDFLSKNSKNKDSKIIANNLHIFLL
jgi:hypothetical protein